MSAKPEYGIIEGFYGRQWSESDRLDTVDFLAGQGYSAWIYAPKGDASLRKNWRTAFNTAWLSSIGRWAQRCRDAGLKWGLGLSPLGLQDNWPHWREDWLAKLEEIRCLQPDYLWCLFDDMPTNRQDLAGVQCEIAAELSVLKGINLAICPGYYSFDARLEAVFGPRPRDYWQQLGAGLAPAVDVLWTGNQVISERIDCADLEAIAAELQRPPVLWDNYPVNDGRETAGHLHLRAPEGREAGLERFHRGHFFNPMNQCQLSRIPLAGFALSRRQQAGAEAITECVIDSLAADCSALLKRDWREFQAGDLADARRLDLLAEYADASAPMAAEVRAWLQGEYRFDPNCLTG